MEGMRLEAERLLAQAEEDQVTHGPSEGGGKDFGMGEVRDLHELRKLLHSPYPDIPLRLPGQG